MNRGHWLLTHLVGFVIVGCLVIIRRLNIISEDVKSIREMAEQASTIHIPDDWLAYLLALINYLL